MGKLSLYLESLIAQLREVFLLSRSELHIPQPLQYTATLSLFHSTTPRRDTHTLVQPHTAATASGTEDEDPKQEEETHRFFGEPPASSRKKENPADARPQPAQ